MADPNDPYAVLLEHATLIWKAEEENARRLSVRVNLNLTVIAAFIGLSIFRLVEGPVGPSWPSWLVRASLGLGLLCLVVAAASLLNLARSFPDEQTPQTSSEGRREGRARLASLKLRLANEAYEQLPNPQQGTAQFARYQALLRLNDAGVDLGEQNVREDLRIDRGQQWMLVGFLFILLGVVSYAIFGVVEKPVRAAGEVTKVWIGPE